MDVNLTEIFKNFISTLDKSTVAIFEKYCLGVNTSSPLSYEEYYKLLGKTLRYRHTFGHHRIRCLRLSSTEFIHSPLDISNKDDDYFYYVSVVPGRTLVGNKIIAGKYPIFTIKNFEYWTGVVFLIHDSFQIKSIDNIEFSDLAKRWFEYSSKEILNVSSTICKYRYANADNIYVSDTKLNTTELKKLKIYTNRFFGPTKIKYEEE